MRHRHDGLLITPVLASRWLGHFRRAMEATVAAQNDRRAIFAQVRSLAMALVSGQVAPARPPGEGTGLAGRTFAEANQRTAHGQWPGAASAPAAWRGRGISLTVVMSGKRGDGRFLAAGPAAHSRGEVADDGIAAAW